MYLIVGLGNPGNEYSVTRHNMGFEVIDVLCEKHKIKINKAKFKGNYGQGEIAGEKVILLKPQTFMNNSGESISEVKKFYKIENEKIIVIYDDADLEVGEIRIRQKGRANTHNGMKSVVQYLGTEEFPRVRVGIGAPDKEIADYVLERISKKEYEELSFGIVKAAETIEEIIKNGIESAMNKFN